jgi:glycosyltransferase involved in cell wall biosynthesis
MKRAVLQVVNGLSPVGGAETIAVTLALRASSGWEPHVLCLRDASPETPSTLEAALASGGIPVHHLAMDGLRDLGTGIALARLLRRIRVQVIHAHNRPSDAWAMLWSALAGTRVRLYTRHLTYTDVSDAMRRRYRYAARAAHAVVAVSSAVAGHLIREERTPEHRVVTIRNGIDLARFDVRRGETRGPGEALRLAWGISPDLFLVGTLSRLTSQKGLDLFLEVAARLLAEEDRVRFAVVGQGEARADLEARARSLGIAERVVFPGHQHAPSAFAAFDLFLTTSRYEGLPLTLLEAMASGLPVVAPRIGAFPEVVEDGVTGLLPAPPEWLPTVVDLDPTPFVQATLRLLRNPTLRARLGEAGRKRVGETFGLDAMVARYEALYERILNRGSSP